MITGDCLAEETGVWQKNAKGVDSFSVPLLYTVVGCQESLGEKPRQLTPFGFRMIKIITRAKANPAKETFSSVELEQNCSEKPHFPTELRIQ